MSSIYLAAIIASILAITIIGVIILKVLKKKFLPLALFSIFYLPASYIAFTFIRVPLDKFIIKLFNISGSPNAWPTWYVLILLLYAPIIEELIKILPLGLPWIRKKVTFNNRIAVGMLVGLGFGIGELWFIAFQLYPFIPRSGYHWYQLWGFILERLISCFSHGVFTIVALQTLFKRSTKYIFYAIGLHIISNFPVLLFRLGIIRLDGAIFQYLMALYLSLFTVVLILILRRSTRGELGGYNT